MKDIMITIILSISLLTATVTNDGATITIGDGVVMRVDGDFAQEGTLNIDGTFSISGTFSGEFNGSEGYTWGYFGGATIESSSFDNLLIEGDATLAGDVNANSLNLSDGALNLNGHDISLSESGVFSQSNGSLVGSGYIHGYDGSNLGLSIDVSDPNTTISLSGEAVAHDGVNSIQKHYIFSNST